jgi:hypothetical protein
MSDLYRRRCFSHSSMPHELPFADFSVHRLFMSEQRLTTFSIKAVSSKFVRCIAPATVIRLQLLLKTVLQNNLLFYVTVQSVAKNVTVRKSADFSQICVQPVHI